MLISESYNVRNSNVVGTKKKNAYNVSVINNGDK